MPVVTSAPFLTTNETDLLERGLRLVLFRQFERATGEYEPLYNLKDADKAVMSDVDMFGVAQYGLKTEGDPPDYDNLGEAYKKQYTIFTYGLGIKASKESIDDELYGFTAKFGAEMGDAARYTMEILAMAPLNNLSLTQYTAEGTNYPLFSTTHYRADGGTRSNRLSSGADLDTTSIELGLTQFRQQMLDHRGNKMRIRPKQLWVGAQDEWNAMRILNSVQRAYTPDNDANVVKNMLDLHVLTHMTDDKRWVLAADKSKHTLTFFTKQGLEVNRETDGTGSGNMIMSCTFRVAVGATGPLGLLASF